MLDKEHYLGDDELIRHLKRGDHRFFALFADRYDKYILKKCQIYVRESEVAKDLRQEVLIKVFLQVHHFREEAHLKTWLYTIIHHTCIDYLRRNKRKVRDIYLENLSDSISEMADFQEEPSEALSLELLNHLLDEITSEEKFILMLKYNERHSIRDIMKTLDISESAVKMRLKRAREHVNRLYEEKTRKQPQTGKKTS